MNIPDPAGMELRPWVEGVITAVSQYQNLADMYDDDWQQWGMCFFNSPQLGILHPPNPYQFTDWVNWGQRLSDTLLNAKGANFSPGGKGSFLGTEGLDILATESNNPLSI